MVGTRNVFALGFVPVKTENTVVLLSREVHPNHQAYSAIKDLDLDLNLWQPIIVERSFVPWLVKVYKHDIILNMKNNWIDRNHLNMKC